jgi:hypothetical protein
MDFRKAGQVELQLRQLSFPSRILDRWRKGRCDDLLRELAPDSFIQRVLAEKLERRPPSRRFFGEAYVTHQLRPQAGWYGSFKWLTSWPRTPASSFGAEYRDALQAAFPEVSGMPARALSLRQHLGGKSPVAPDLWLVLEGQHHFIEVKLPGDRTRPTQVAGLAAIATWLAPESKVVVSVCELYPEGRREPSSANEIREMFKRFCEICARMPSSTATHDRSGSPHRL